MLDLTTIQKIAVWALPILFAITLHEAAHGYIAKRLGDPTAERLGRLSLNPIRHIDPLGTILVPILLLVTAGFAFGWAKPVPITRENLNHPKRDMAWVAVAGPGSNLIMALIWAMLAKLGVALTGSWPAIGEPLMLMGIAGIWINVILAVLNMLPLPPLDGSRVLAAFLPGRLEWQFNRLEPYGMWVLLALAVFGVLWWIILPPSRWLVGVFLSLIY